MSKKYIIKIPNENNIIYCEKKQILTLIGFFTKKSLKLQVKLNILKSKKAIQVTSKSFITLSNNEKKKVKAIKGTTVALIKQALIETSSILYQKLKFVGVGYRAFEIENYKNKLIMFKLGYSHSIFFKIPTNLKIACLKLTKLFIYGNSYQQITQTAALIQSYKIPEPYKGKGILYENEKIILKEGKKV